MTDTLDDLALRYLSGRPLRDRPGTYPYLSRGDGRWSGIQRQALRLGTPTAVALATYGAHAHPGTTRAVACAAAAGSWSYARSRWGRRRFHRAYISPTVKAISVPVGTATVDLQVDPRLGQLVPRLARSLSPAEEQLREWYGRRVEPLWRVPVGRAGRGVDALTSRIRPALQRAHAWLTPPRPTHGPRIRLTVGAPYVTSEQRSLISAIVKAKIPVSDLVESWDQVGAEVTATWVPRKRPPASVGLEDLVLHGRGLEDWEFYLGQGAGDVPVTISLRDDSPHLAVSAGSGAGKSVLAQLLAVQVLARGGRVVILDRKGSHRWALDLPGVDYCIKPEQMHDALIKASMLADKRNIDALREPEGWDPGPRVLVICEELNATIAQLAAWWEDNREKGQPKRSPAIRALNDIAFMGRSAKVHLLAIAQMLTARAVGGPEARENFGVRCLARYTVNAWKMLVPECGMPKATRTLGRWQIVVAGAATETQVCYLTAAQARAYARPDVAASTGVPCDIADQAPIKAIRDITIREAVDEGVVPWSWQATRKRLERGVGVPPKPTDTSGAAYRYDREQLTAWVARCTDKAAA